MTWRLCARCRKGSGFTLVELLVVIGIFAILVALLLSAVQRARDAANRVTCANNLKQLALAAHTRHDVFGAFPPAAVTSPTRHGWAVHLLPFFEQTPLYQLYDWSRNWYDSANQAVVTVQLTLMQCPSAPANRTQQGVVGGVPWAAAAGDYLPLRGVNSSLELVDLVPMTPDWKGIMRFNQQTRLADVTDGSSVTLLLAEDAGRPQRWEMGRQVPGASSGGAGWAAFGNQAILDGYHPSDGTPLGACAVNCTNNGEVYSFHPGGAHAVFADGAVHFLRADLSVEVLAALITRRGEEIVPGDAYQSARMGERPTITVMGRS